MLPTQSASLRLRAWYTRFGTKPAGTSDMLARSSLRCATLAPSSTSTLCLRSLASFTKTFMDSKGAQNLRLLNNAAWSASRLRYDAAALASHDGMRFAI